MLHRALAAAGAIVSKADSAELWSRARQVSEAEVKPSSSKARPIALSSGGMRGRLRASDAGKRGQREIARR